MTTKSTVAQMLLVERVREMREDDPGGGADESESADQDDDTPDQNEADRSADAELPEIFHEHDDMWMWRGDEYEHNISVRAPRDGEDAKYYQYKTVEHAKERLEKEFGE